MDQVYDDITKITQACTTAQENNGKLIENIISQPLTKLQDIKPKPRSSQTSNSSYEANWTLSWQTTTCNMPQQSNNDMYHLQRPYETHTSPHALCKSAVPQLNLFQLQSIHSWIISKTDRTNT